MSDWNLRGLSFALIACAGLFGAETVEAQTAAQSAQASIQYLKDVMDAYHGRFAVYEDVSSAGNHFHAYAMIPDETATVDINGSWTSNPHSGATALRCDYTATPGGFGGFYFQNGTLTGSQTIPQPNFGTVANAGVNLTGATSLTFWARGAVGGEQVEFFVAGVGRDPVTGAATQPFPDSSPRRPSNGTRTVLGTSWQQYTIDLTGMDLSYVLGGFGWVASAAFNPAGAVFFIDDIEYVLSPAARDARLNQPRFLRSFTTLPLQPDPFDATPDGDIDFVLRNLAFAYDNALAIRAFLADGTADSIRRARLIGDAFVYALQHDRKYNDNRTCAQTIDPLTVDGARVRTAYAAGDLTLPPGWSPLGRVGTVPIPGFYMDSTATFHEVEQGAVDMGNNAWPMIALAALYDRTAEPSYLDAACKIGNFIHSFRNDSGTYRGFTGGINDPESAPALRPWASSEHNIDIYAAFTALHRITGATRWQEDAEHARQFVEAMWEPGSQCYLAGTSDPSNRNTNPDQLPLDVQPWAVLALPGVLSAHPAVLGCAEANHLNTHDGFTGFDFNADRDGVWFEGTAHMAAAYALAGRTSDANTYRQVLRAAQAAPFGDGKGIAAACHDGVTTGFGFKLFRRLHLGATSWNVFAQLGVDPYYQTLTAPTGLDARFNGAAATLTWSAAPGAASYEVSRTADGQNYAVVGTPASPGFNDSSVAAGSAYLYRVRAKAADASTSAWSAVDLMTAVSFTEDPLIAQTTTARGAHVTQLRTAVSSVRTLANLGAASFTDPSLASVPIRAVHVTELRAALAAARSALALVPLSFAQPTLSASAIVRAVDLGELREGVR